jgi:hypothetical protein
MSYTYMPTCSCFTNDLDLRSGHNIRNISTHSVCVRSCLLAQASLNSSQTGSQDLRYFGRILLSLLGLGHVVLEHLDRRLKGGLDVQVRKDVPLEPDYVLGLLGGATLSGKVCRC